MVSKLLKNIQPSPIKPQDQLDAVSIRKIEKGLRKLGYSRKNAMIFTRHIKAAIAASNDD